METWKYGIAILFVLALFASIHFFKKKRASDFASALQSGDSKRYEKALFSKINLFVLEPNMLFLMRSNYYTSKGQLDEAEKCLKVVHPEKLHFDAAINYYQAMMSFTFSNKDVAKFDKLIEGLKSRITDENKDFVNAIIENQNVNRKLYFDFDASVIEDIKKLVEVNHDEAKGMLYMNLAKAYHLNKDDKQAKESLKQAMSYLKNTPYQKVIESTLNDLSILD